nr:hypothetical protein Q903MT_gene2344 [Picea sitchensis]
MNALSPIFKSDEKLFLNISAIPLLQRTLVLKVELYPPLLRYRQTNDSARPLKIE